MDSTSLIGPAVVAAVVSSIVSLIGFLINRATARSVHTERLAFDKEQAERRLTAEIALAERRFTYDVGVTEAKSKADVALAEKKLAFDKAMIAWRRQYELAEQVLSAAYEARDALNWARGRGMYSGEGKTRVPTESESEIIKEARDSAYVPIERLQAHSKAFSTLQTLRDSVVAHFNSEAAKPIADIFEVYQRITSAAAMLIQHAAWNEDRDARRALQPFRDDIYGKGAEPDTAKVTAAIQQLETLLRPILSGQIPT